MRTINSCFLMLLASSITACSGSNSGNTGGDTSLGGSTNGGSSASGGAAGGSLGTGGNIATGGTNATGGINAAGGTPSTGGSKATGGIVSTGGTPTVGGTASTGGSQATGGATTAGGASSTGGKVTGGATSTGGTPATGGTKAAGGATSTGGTKATGGATSTGGASATGGTSGNCPAVNPNLFAIGADISNMETSSDDSRAALLTFLKSHGFNYIRLRTFVIPMAADGYDKKYGYDDLTHTVAFGKQVKDACMGLLVDFHYSDNWADPGKQCVPVAWQSYTTITDLCKCRSRLHR